MKRNTAKEKMKRNKGFPYKSRLSLKTNATQKYAIVDEEGKILEKFYHLQTTRQMLHYYKDKYYPIKLRIIRL